MNDTRGADDPHDLGRFVEAQEGVFDRALAELRAGRKRTHWMWFVFPQLDGLGRSPTAQRYAIGDIDEALAYLRHPVLGPRLRECVDALLALDLNDAVAVLGPVDAMKLRSSMTLFAIADPDEPAIANVLDKFFDGVRDDATAALL